MTARSVLNCIGHFDQSLRNGRRHNAGSFPRSPHRRAWRAIANTSFGSHPNWVDKAFTTQECCSRHRVNSRRRCVDHNRSTSIRPSMDVQRRARLQQEFPYRRNLCSVTTCRRRSSEISEAEDQRRRNNRRCSSIYATRPRSTWMSSGVQMQGVRQDTQSSHESSMMSSFEQIAVEGLLHA